LTTGTLATLTTGTLGALTAGTLATLTACTLGALTACTLGALTACTLGALTACTLGALTACTLAALTACTLATPAALAATRHHDLSGSGHFVAGNGPFEIESDFHLTGGSEIHGDGISFQAAGTFHVSQFGMLASKDQVLTGSLNT
jgi:hypothetical protein